MPTCLAQPASPNNSDCDYEEEVPPLPSGAFVEEDTIAFCLYLHTGNALLILYI